MKYRIPLLFLSILLITFSCRRDEEFIEDSSARINFSTDSIAFDTVFTTIGSVTKNFRVYNPHKDRIKISSIRLNGGSNSNFRINVDGRPGSYFQNIEIASKDSLFIFLEVTVDPNNLQNPFVIEDYIEFTTNGNVQRVDLVAWGQNAIYYTPTTFNRNLPDFTCLTGPCGDNIPPVDVTWTDSLPYVIYGYIAIDTLDRLTIEAGTKVYFHNNGGMWVYRGGSLRVNGTQDNPVLFRGDRLEPRYEDIPGQWDRIWINEGGNNEINHAIIKNAFIGVQAEALFLNGSPSSLGSLSIKNTRIENSSNTGFLSALFNVNGENLVITNSGQHNVSLQSQGNWNFDHCTFANYFNDASRETPALSIQNGYLTPAGILVDTPVVNIRNSIVYGNLESEFNTELITDARGDKGFAALNFSNVIIQTEMSTADTNVYKNIIRNPSNSIFKDPFTGDYELRENSVAIDAGNINVGNLVPFDLKGNSRTIDGKPDLGAYEYEP